MSLRCKFYPDGSRIIISRPGFDASPGLADENKIFDSDWDFSNLYLEGGDAVDPQWSSSGAPTSNIPITIMFKRTYNFVPAAMVWGYYTVSAGILGKPLGDPQAELPGWGPASKIYNDRIVLSRYPNDSRWFAAQTLRYALFSVL